MLPNNEWKAEICFLIVLEAVESKMQVIVYKGAALLKKKNKKVERWKGYFKPFYKAFIWSWGQNPCGLKLYPAPLGTHLILMH